MRVHIVDPSAYTPPYDHALCAALARAGASVELFTSRFAYGEANEPAGYSRREFFYRSAPGPAGSARRRVAKLLEHVPDMLRYRRLAGREADVVHFQWLAIQWLDGGLLPRRPTVLTAHDLLPREPRAGQARAQRRLYDAVDAIVVHSRYGRDQLVERLAVAPGKVHIVPHGAFTHLAELRSEQRLSDELTAVQCPVVLFFGLLRPYKGLEVLLEAWRGISDAELWIVGRPRMRLDPLRAMAPSGVRFVPRFVPDEELAAYFHRADVVVLPYTRTERFDQSGVLASALAFGKPIVLSDVGGLREVAATGAGVAVAPDDPDVLRAAIAELIGDAPARERMAAAAFAAARGAYSWELAAQKTLAVYESILR
jgi:glycosyltransferase involved in cell wall biosynthesis